jgi:ABC-type branched-subunit amino acid transport system substrate-binding protein
MPADRRQVRSAPAVGQCPAQMRATAAMVIIVTALALGACLPVTRPTIKIGLVAPFEGRYREIGYEVIYAVRLAVREANSSGGAGGYSIELVSLDDGGNVAAAVEQAHKLTTDPLLIGVIGHWMEATTAAAAPIYAEAGLPMLATAAGPLPESTFSLWPSDGVFADAAQSGASCLPDCPNLEESAAWLARQSGRHQVFGPPLWAQPQFATIAGSAAEGVIALAPAPLPADSTDPSFAWRFAAISDGVEPRANAVLAYDATRLMLAAIAEAALAEGKPTPGGVAQSLGVIEFAGLSGMISFDAERRWQQARAWLYVWRDGMLVRP